MGLFCLIFGSSALGYQSPRYVKMADEITERVAKQLKAEKNLCLAGTGGGMMNDIQMMAMSFYFYQEVDLKTARELMAYTINKYLKEINSNKEIRPFLHEYPFTAKNVEIRIWIKPNGLNQPLDKIYSISAIKGILTYYLDLPETYSRQAPCKETYEEASQTIFLRNGNRPNHQEEYGSIK